MDHFHIMPDTDPSMHGFKGRIYLFDFNQPEKAAQVVPLKGDFDKNNFRPHGIDIWEDKETGLVRLFVVNHGKVDTIEAFEFDQDQLILKHRRTFKHKLMISVNDVLATGRNSFYFTNDAMNRGGVRRMLESLLLCAWSTVVYYDGRDAKVVLDKGHMYNGINMSPNKKFVYVNQLTSNTMSIYKREASNSLTFIQSMNLQSRCDNIFVDEGGDIWHGCHPIGHKFHSHAKKFTYPAPAQVLHVKAVSGGNTKKYQIREVLSDDGSLVKGSSVAAYFQGAMLVGTVMDNMAYCQIKSF
ncbi:serum paraoxonase/arylesterase 2-like isoform X2 [Anneissia japonica]|nr:serum paraoxonase/arylesterase 2-like isoform X2 [Anneissia japonica]